MKLGRQYSKYSSTTNIPFFILTLCILRTKDLRTHVHVNFESQYNTKMILGINCIYSTEILHMEATNLNFKSQRVDSVNTVLS